MFIYLMKFTLSESETYVDRWTLFWVVLILISFQMCDFDILGNWHLLIQKELRYDSIGSRAFYSSGMYGVR